MKYVLLLILFFFQWEVMPDLFFYRDPEAVEKEENERAENEQVMKSGADFAAPPQKEEWGGEDRVEDWSADGQPAAPAAAAPVAPVSGYHVTEDWSASTETTDWAAASSEQAAAPNWGGSNQW